MVTFVSHFVWLVVVINGQLYADNAQLHLTVVVYYYLNVQRVYIYYVKNLRK